MFATGAYVTMMAYQFEGDWDEDEEIWNNHRSQSGGDELPIYSPTSSFSMMVEIEEPPPAYIPNNNEDGRERL
jgi:hypothetical protein